MMNILVVDNSKAVREKLIRYLELEKHFDIVFEVNTVKEAERIMQNINIEVVLLDIQLPGRNGLEFVSFINGLLCKPVLILCTNYTAPQYKKTYEKLSVNYLFDKSSELKELKNFIKEFVKTEKIFRGVIGLEQDKIS